jgi:3D (Asp-Asp-Asp) domain-containing protein
MERRQERSSWHRRRVIIKVALGVASMGRSGLAYPGARFFRLIIRLKSSRYGTLMTKAFRPLAFGLTLLCGGCAENAKFASGGKVCERKSIRTTAYTDSEFTHRRWGVKNAVGSHLESGEINSAAADWSQFPVGTKFRIVENSKVYVVDDYGSALVGTNTIDLYMPSIRQMNQWGTRKVTIEVLEQGSYIISLKVLKTRQRVRCVRRMVEAIEKKVDDRL